MTISRMQIVVVGSYLLLPGFYFGFLVLRSQVQEFQGLNL